VCERPGAAKRGLEHAAAQAGRATTYIHRHRRTHTHEQARAHTHTQTQTIASAHDPLWSRRPSRPTHALRGTHRRPRYVRPVRQVRDGAKALAPDAFKSLSLGGGGGGGGEVRREVRGGTGGEVR
jgi:hypothetical protein